MGHSNFDHIKMKEITSEINHIRKQQRGCFFWDFFYNNNVTASEHGVRNLIHSICERKGERERERDGF